MSTPHLDRALARLGHHFATRTIPARIAASPDYDRALGERVCRLAEELAVERGGTFEAAIDDFITACAELLTLQRELERTGRYRCASFSDARRVVYDDERVMATTYLRGLLLSQALWTNHQRILRFFHESFCSTCPRTGLVLEVPVGTGLFLSELLRCNPAWTGHGVDLSPVAVDFAARLIRRDSGAAPVLRSADIFELDHARQFDRVICGELLEHVDDPGALLAALDGLLAEGGEIFLTTAIWSASPDHVYLFESAAEVRRLLRTRFVIRQERVLPLDAEDDPHDERVPINYACVLVRDRRDVIDRGVAPSTM